MYLGKLQNWPLWPVNQEKHDIKVLTFLYLFVRRAWEQWRQIIAIIAIAVTSFSCSPRHICVQDTQKVAKFSTKEIFMWNRSEGILFQATKAFVPSLTLWAFRGLLGIMMFTERTTDQSVRAILIIIKPTHKYFSWKNPFCSQMSLKRTRINPLTCLRLNSNSYLLFKMAVIPVQGDLGGPLKVQATILCCDWSIGWNETFVLYDPCLRTRIWNLDVDNILRTDHAKPCNEFSFKNEYLSTRLVTSFPGLFSL